MQHCMVLVYGGLIYNRMHISQPQLLKSSITSVGANLDQSLLVSRHWSDRQCMILNQRDEIFLLILCTLLLTLLSLKGSNVLSIMAMERKRYQLSVQEDWEEKF